MTIFVGARFLRYGLIAGGLLVVEGAGQAADPPQTADVLGDLHQADQKEIEAGMIAQKNGGSQAVRDYGRMLVKDHSAADKKLADLATKENIDLLASTPARGANDMGTMATGPSFDLKFAQEMLEDHRKAIAAVNDARDNTNDPQLKKLLGDLLPTLEKHESAAEKIIDSQIKKR
jgi:putative membrane protein